MDLAFFWMVLFVFALILLLEAASLLPHDSRRHRITIGGLFLLVTGAFAVTTGMMMDRQLPSFSLALPTFFLSRPS
jgi:hypothetical protein